MARSVKLVEGLHITATDKRTILACLDFVSQHPDEAGRVPWLSKKRSPKAYALSHIEGRRYAVLIRENYTNDYGAKRERTDRVVVEISA